MTRDPVAIAAAIFLALLIFSAIAFTREGRAIAEFEAINFRPLPAP